jgi:hypothetical protein
MSCKYRGEAGGLKFVRGWRGEHSQLTIFWPKSGQHTTLPVDGLCWFERQWFRQSPGRGMELVLNPRPQLNNKTLSIFIFCFFYTYDTADRCCFRKKRDPFLKNTSQLFSPCSIVQTQTMMPLE